MGYKVTLHGSDKGQEFKFYNWDDAFNFASMAVEAGEYREHHLVEVEGGYTTKFDDPVPIEVTIIKEND